MSIASAKIEPSGIYSANPQPERPWVVFDMDEVLVDTRTQMVEIMRAKHNRHIPWQQWPSIYLPDVYDVPLSDVMSGFSDYAVLENCVVEKYAASELGDLKRRGFNIGVLTARGWHEESVAISRATLDKAGVHYDRIVTVSMDVNKADYCELFGPIAAYVDDNEKHVQSMLEKGVPAFLLERPWNKHSALPKITRIRDLPL